LWRKGKSAGRHDYPDFGQYIPKNYFKAFQAAAPYCWCDEIQWYKDNRDKPCQAFLPRLQQYNQERRELLKVVEHQSLLDLESCWLTKDCCFRSITTLTSMSVVDMHRWIATRGMGRVDGKTQTALKSPSSAIVFAAGLIIWSRGDGHRHVYDAAEWQCNHLMKAWKGFGMPMDL
jgi:hypothetical protein